MLSWFGTFFGPLFLVVPPSLFCGGGDVYYVPLPVGRKSFSFSFPGVDSLQPAFGLVRSFQFGLLRTPGDEFTLC